MKNEPIAREDSLRIQISLAAITALLVLCMMFVFMVADSALWDNGFRALHRDPGVRGLKMLVYMVPYYALMPIYVFGLGGVRMRFFRWFAVAIAGLGFVFWILHHLSHWQLGERHTFGSNVIDLSLHAVGLWLLISSVKWARVPVTARDTQDAPVARNVAFQRS